MEIRGRTRVYRARQRRPHRDGLLPARERERWRASAGVTDLERAASPAGGEGLRVQQEPQSAFAGGNGPALRPVAGVRPPVLPALLRAVLAAGDPPWRRNR